MEPKPMGNSLGDPKRAPAPRGKGCVLQVDDSQDKKLHDLKRV